MPTKLNKGGNQQQYIPAGNGDASGEYANNTEGSENFGGNKHFSAFKKPTKEPKKRNSKQYWFWENPEKTTGFTVDKDTWGVLKLKKGQSKEIIEKDIWEKIKNKLEGKVSEQELSDKLDEILNNLDYSKGNFALFKEVERKISEFLDDKYVPYYSISDISSDIMWSSFRDEIKDKKIEYKYGGNIKDVESLNSQNVSELLNKNIKCRNDAVKKVVNDALNDCEDEDGKQLFALSAISGVVSFGADTEEYIDFNGKKKKYGVCYSPNKSSVFLREDDYLGNPAYKKGQVPFHEVFHSLDYKFGNDSASPVTQYKILSNGKTLHETLKKEVMGNKQKREGLIEKITTDYYKEKSEMKDNYPGYREAEKKYDDLREKVRSLKTIEYPYKNADGSPMREWPSYEDSPESLALKKSDEYINARETYLKLEREVNSEWYKDNKQRWGDVSDIIDGMTGGKENLCGMGHPSSYWNEDAGHRAREFFAEYASSKFMNKESNEKIKKYFPETAKAAEELIQYMINNKKEIFK